MTKLALTLVQGFPGGSAGEGSTSHAGDLGLIPGLGRSPGEGNGYSLQCFGLENSMDCIVHGVANSWTGQQFALTFALKFNSLFGIDFSR